jgi:hypothetical protein
MNAPTTSSDDGLTAAFLAIDQSLISEGPAATLDLLIARLEAGHEYRAMLDALLLKARFDLGLPLVQVGSLAGIAEPTRSQYEDKYVEAIRRVGGLLLASGEIASAWPYFRAIGEKDAVTKAIDAYVPSGEPGDEQLGQIIDIAFNQGAHPVRGYGFILEHYGICSAITAFEHLPPDDSVRLVCAEKLVRTLHTQLVANLRDEIARQGHTLPPEGTPIGKLIEDHSWLFDDDAYHIDISHLGSVVRIAPMLTDPEVLKLAIGLTDYGRNLSERHHYNSEPPFENLYIDHGFYLRALISEDVETAVGHFLAKLPTIDPEIPPAERMDDPLPAQVLVRLLLRVNRAEQAIEIAKEQLVGLPESMLTCPSLAQICQIAGRPDKLAEISREQGDLVNYAAAMLQVETK